MSEEELNPTEDQNQSDDSTGGQSDTGQVGTDSQSGVAYDDGQEPQQPLDAEPAEDPEPHDDKTTAAFEKKINRLTWKRHEERRKRKELEARLADVEKQGQQQKEIVNVPPRPDPFDDNFEAKMAEREKALQRAAQLNAQQQFERENQQRQAAAELERIQKQANDNRQKMYESSLKYGIDSKNLEEAENRVADFLRMMPGGSDLAMHLVSHEESSLIVNYLGQNISEMEKIGQMNPYQAVAYIENSVRREAAKLKPKLTQTPNPVRAPKAKGAPKKQSEFLDGVTFE